MNALVLASSSPRRRRLLRALGVPFSVRVPNVDERPLAGESPAAHVRRLAREKARAVAAALGPARGARWVLGADTVVVLDGAILGKPRDTRAAVRMLARLSGRPHEVLTGVALVPVGGGRPRTLVARSRVLMKPFSVETIRRYVATGEPLDKAGAYALQGRGRRLVSRVDGSRSNVVGLPLERLRRALAAPGVGLTPIRAYARIQQRRWLLNLGEKLDLAPEEQGGSVQSSLAASSVIRQEPRRLKMRPGDRPASTDPRVTRGFRAQRRS